MKNTFLLLFLIICFQPTFSEGYWKRLDSTVYPVSSFATDGKCMVSCGINQYKIGPNFKDYFSRSFITLSNDGGTTWREIFASESDSSAGILGNFYAINNLRIIDSNNITAWGFDYIKADYSYKFVTTDKGANWEMTPVLDDEGNKIYVQNFQMVTHDYGALYDGWNGVYAIEDSGKTIHKISGYDTSELIVGKVQRIDSMTFVLTG